MPGCWHPDDVCRSSKGYVVIMTQQNAIVFYPTCSNCRKPIHNTIDYEETIEDYGWYKKESHIYPEFCPNCGC